MEIFGWHRHKDDDPWCHAPPWALELHEHMLRLHKQISAIQQEIVMATQAQIDKLLSDVAALIEAGVAEISAAVAAAQTASPDPAIDAADVRVTVATDNLKAAAAALTGGTPLPPPVAGG
jgi:hypothetical protein